MKKPEKSEKVFLKTTSPAYVLPLFYDGKYIKIRHDKATPLEVKKLNYESKIHIEQAIAEKALIKVKEENKQ